ncbi:MAG: nucleotidyltransferase domain-containing protein [Thermodesulfobacteriota bacterium]
MLQTRPLLDDVRTALVPVFRKYAVRRAVLFGSFARGEATRHSDVDILATVETPKRFFDRYDGILADLGRALPEVGVDLLLYTPAELQSISHRPFIRRALEEGQVIYESDEIAA